MKIVWSCTLTALLLFSMSGISAAGEKAAGTVPAAVNEKRPAAGQDEPETAQGREKGQGPRLQTAYGQAGQETALAAGQEKQTGYAMPRMGLRECMSYAVSNSTKMRIRQAATNDAQINRREAILKAFLPQISANTYAYYNFGRSIDPQTNTYFNQTSFHNNYGVGAGITLFDGFSAVNNMKIAKTALQMGRTEEEQAEADICLAVMEAFCNAAYYNHIQDIQAEHVGLAAQSYEKARFQEELGQVGHADVVQMAANLAESEYDLVQAQNAYVEHLSKLMDLMFWPVDEPFVPVLDFSADDSGETAPDFPECREVLEYAKSDDPSVILAQAKVLNARRELNTAKWRLLPSLELYGGWSTSYYTYIGAEAGTTTPFADQFKHNGGEYVQLQLNIPIFSAAGRQNNIARKRNALATATAEYEQKMHDIESEVARAYNDFDGAVNAYTQACRKAELQEEAFRLNTRKMEQGLISSIEHKTSSNSYLRAMADKLNMRLQMLIKGSIVRYYHGEHYIDQF